ncbi:MAG TPA: ribulose-phosphate 3-epimerase [Ferroplasma sp.]|jgi:ribulose-phosphate 3-epimerase|nr:ribulose-phosphate 3-epimerase [Ferroplasma sp.]HII82920.1 ribulose-phosphate 3-epimerase [Ferroplasma sp.]
MEISPSIISSDLLDLGSQIRECQNAGAGSFHLDIMDGHFVDNITMGPDMVSAIRKGTDLRLDGHLMIERPDKYYKSFIDAGCDVLLIHYETPIEVGNFLKKLDNENIKYGIVINPDTDIKKIYKFIPYCEIVLVMSVYPGFSGQKFIEKSLEKVRALRKYIDDNNYSTKIEIDGGINDETGKLAAEAGADILVSASYIFKNGIARSIKKLKSL